MNKLITLVALVATLAGCQTNNVVVRKEPYPVFTTIPVVPQPPTVDRCEFKVDLLTDNSDPGTVAMAYKHDIECLRSKIIQFETVLQQYKLSADEADKIGEEIKKQFKAVIDKYNEDIAATEKQAAEKGISIR